MQGRHGLREVELGQDAATLGAPDGLGRESEHRLVHEPARDRSEGDTDVRCGKDWSVVNTVTDKGDRSMFDIFDSIDLIGW